MTLEEMRNQVWDGIGRPTNLDPSVSATTLNWVVNEAQRQVAGWRDPQLGRRVRFNCLYSTMNFYSVVLTGTLTAVNNTTFPYSVSQAEVRSNDAADRYNGWVIEMTSGDADGESRMITDNAFGAGTNVLYVEEAFDNLPAIGDTYTMYKSWMPIYPSAHVWSADGIALPAATGLNYVNGNLLEVLRVKDISNARVLEIAGDKSSFVDCHLSTGDPRQWYRFGNKLYFDYNVSDNRWFEAEYYRMPTSLSTTSDVPEIPETFHWAMVLWGIWWGHRVRRESSNAYSAKLDFIDTMRQKVGDMDLLGERAETQFKMDMGGSRYQ